MTTLDQLREMRENLRVVRSLWAGALIGLIDILIAEREPSPPPGRTVYTEDQRIWAIVFEEIEVMMSQQSHGPTAGALWTLVERLRARRDGK